MRRYYQVVVSTFGLMLGVTAAMAEIPVPLSGSTPVDVATVRKNNPAVLPMTGTWRFEPVRGGFVGDGKFVSVPVSASSVQLLPMKAVDGDRNTRWCASNGEMPQWVQIDLGTPQQITGLTLAWEHPDGHYRFKVQASDDSRDWRILADRSEGDGVGDGTVELTPARARFVRITIVSAAKADGTAQWASISEIELHLNQGGRDVVWTPPEPSTTEVASPAFARAEFDDHAWHDIPVPGNWEMHGFSEPTYDHADDAAGLYRRVVNVPASFNGQQVFWHFDAVMDGAEVFVNGKRMGYHESGFTGWDMNITDALKPGQPNIFALRVCKMTPSVSLDSGDFWNLGGISRNTYLKAVPPTHIDDMTVVTKLSPEYVDATLDTTVRVRGTNGQSVSVNSALYGIDGKPVDGVAPSATGTIGEDGTVDLNLSAPVTKPKLWSAEYPNLYYVVFSLTADGKPVETAQQRFGFRQIEIRDKVLLWNGVPIKCTGICRHEEWSALGHALDEHAWETDVSMIKAANINAVRTSHYNHAVRFLELCDEKGLYVLDEIPACFCDPKDLSLKDAFVQHAVESLNRDKNLPCVLAWSCGNESGWGPDFKAMVDYVTAHDPTRPRFVSEQSKKEDPQISFNDWHYPDTDAFRGMVKSDDGPWIVTEGPHTFYGPERDYDLGCTDLWGEVLAKQWSYIWPCQRILGGFIWEWQDQGLLDPFVDPPLKDARGVTHENHKGVVDGFRNPKPELYHVKEVYSPVVSSNRTLQPNKDACMVELQNRYAFTDLSELACNWHVMAGDKELAAGTSHVHCAPGETVQASFPATQGMDALVLDFVHPDGRNIYTTRLTVLGMPLPLPPPPAFKAGGGGPPQVTDNGDSYSIKVADATMLVLKSTGRVTFPLPGQPGKVMTGPTLNLGQGRHDDGDFTDSNRPRWIGSKSSPQLLHPKVLVTTSGDVAVITVSGGVALAEAPDQILGTLNYVLDVHPDGVNDVKYSLDWATKETYAWEFGLSFSLPQSCDHLGWYRDAQWTSYPPDHIGAVSGRVDAKDVSFAASKRNIVWATLTNPAGDGIALLHTSEPLLVRAKMTANETQLMTSVAEYVPRSFSSGFMDRYKTVFDYGESLTGAFMIRPVAHTAAE